ncbi:MAG: 3-hydroxyacyl-[acyl-carrier-protein] dehydratase FabZ [Candidatus Chloroheliales bacterium]|nr:MAG: 3-hydroxyacyl-[acyl-carrier-protein] dehydratase FabZ [Chloroflexota bacterium]
MELDIDAIRRTIPHRFPFLLVDRIIECEPGQRAVGIKAVSGNEPFFQGHFPDYPLMPGVLILEALAQVAAICVQVMPEYKGKLGVFAGLDNVRFKRQVRPGDLLRLEVTITKLRLPIGTASAEATVDGQLCARADLMFALTDIQMGAAAAENK